MTEPIAQDTKRTEEGTLVGKHPARGEEAFALGGCHRLPKPQRDEGCGHAAGSQAQGLGSAAGEEDVRGLSCLQCGPGQPLLLEAGAWHCSQPKG